MRARLRLLVTAVTLVLTACSGAAGDPGASPAVDAGGVEVARVNDAVARVADLHRAAIVPVRDALASVAALDEAVRGLGDPATVRETADAFSDAATSIDGDTLAGLRTSLTEVAVAVDDTRAVLADVRSGLGPSWERRWLDAEDDVLQAVREDARTADAVVQILERHRDVLDRVQRTASDFVVERSFFRDDEEAANAFLVRLDPIERDYATATAELDVVVEQREAAAASLAAAVAAADAVWQARPDGA
jgi:hypothetical protein